jgi:hypothetical protein
VAFELAKAAGKRHVLGAADVLVAQEQYFVLQQQGPDIGKQTVVAGGCAQMHAADLGANGTGQGFHP